MKNRTFGGEIMLKKKLSEQIIFIMLILPSLVGLLIFYIIPFIISLYYAVMDNSISKNFVGFKNIIDIMKNDAFRTAGKNTLIFLSICVPLNMLIPLFFALLLNKISNNKRRVFLLAIVIPLVIPSGSIVFFWSKLFGYNGLINGTFFASSPIDWINTDFSILLIVIMFLWKNVGYNLILILAGLSFIPGEYYEYASVEGANVIQKFFYITLLNLIPTSILVGIMSIINSFKVFKEIYLLTGAYPNKSVYMLQHYLNNQFTAANYQKLASASFIVFIIIFLIVNGLRYMQKKTTDINTA